MNPDALYAPPTVTLVGAGPGDPDLLTIAAARAIASATLLLVDDLVDEAVLEHARPDARIIRVGKRGGCRSTPQAFICRLMVMGARAGETVVRLKGGDPFVFGRGGEEVEHLRDAGLRVETINGITSGLAAATSIGVPLTHREHAHGVAFVTGHQRPGDEAPDWGALAASARLARLTLVIYMGVGSAEAIQDGLLQGLPSATPVAVVQNASRPDQRHALCTLGRLAATLRLERLGSPSIIVVGDVVRGAAALDQPSAAGSATFSAASPSVCVTMT
ncbi:uroporphyrinogen-III C-methyltransferase [Quisquiliibacterium transsilvanicum]|uniref:uroporphyrinogen-III C-methyltransferase n=1 Tax=Quisquiliibacterium transsilvanicum TaxID=1549638 RepID=A0A7W8HJF6_9BURK|nr:uroporphyrinogen-III C-methyltransferase [Quisquiliibacterium transsilvanicum]MBB5272280.1 uroporphyrin-III C-methyltransferase [Quisquiliibacterium transsilvanicum]